MVIPTRRRREYHDGWRPGMEDGIGGGAEAGDVAGVGRDFGFEEDDVH